MTHGSSAYLAIINSIIRNCLAISAITCHVDQKVEEREQRKQENGREERIPLSAMGAV